MTFYKRTQRRQRRTSEPQRGGGEQRALSFKASDFCRFRAQCESTLKKELLVDACMKTTILKCFDGFGLLVAFLKTTKVLNGVTEL